MLRKEKKAALAVAVETHLIALLEWGMWTCKIM